METLGSLVSLQVDWFFLGGDILALNMEDDYIRPLSIVFYMRNVIFLKNIATQEISW